MRAVLVAAVAAGALLAGADEARACSCRVQPPSAHLSAAAAAFRGEVVTLAEDDEGMLVALFDVDVVYKGEIPRAVTVTTGGAADTCAVPFREGAAYVVFATGEADAWRAHLCGGTTDDRTYIDREGVTPTASYGPDAAPSPGPAEDVALGDLPRARSRAAPIALAALMLSVSAMLLFRARNEASAGNRPPSA